MSGELGAFVEERILVEQDGVPGRHAAFLQIGYPQWMKGGDEATCTVAIKGLDEMMPLVRGRDFFEVLVRAARALKARCKTPPAGVRLFYDDCNEPYTGEPFDREELEDSWRKLATLYPKEWPVLAERKILMQISGSEERTEITLQIGHPYWEVEGETAACPIAMRGLDDGPPAIHGDDPFMALSNAVKYMNEYFAGVQCGRWFFWPNGEPYAGDFPDLPPKRYEPDPRGEPGNWDVLAERILWMERDGEPERRRIRIQIGRPYANDENQVYCPLTIKGWSGGPMGPMAGSTHYSAFVQALGAFETLVMPIDLDARYFWPDGTPYEGEMFDHRTENG